MESQLNVAVKGNEREEREAATVRIQQGAYIVVRSMKPLSHGAISNYSHSQRGGNSAYIRRAIEASSFFFWAFLGDLQGRRALGTQLTVLFETRACFAGVCTGYRWCRNRYRIT